MDVELARTFLEITKAGSFVAAADALHLTQTAVTARIHRLESQLGCVLFIRHRGGVQLTLQGEKFLPYASQILQVWDSARHDLLRAEQGSRLTIGSELSLWSPLLLEWLSLLKEELPAVTFRAEISGSHRLCERLMAGTLDMALLHQPDYHPALQTVQLLEEKLILVCSTDRQGPYLYVDWGQEFCRLHDAALPQQVRAGVQIDAGALALGFLLKNGGSGYFRTRVVQQYLDDGRLRRVEQAPEFSYPVYLVYLRKNTNEVIEQSKELIQRIVVNDGGSWS